MALIVLMVLVTLRVLIQSLVSSWWTKGGLGEVGGTMNNSANVMCIRAFICGLWIVVLSFYQNRCRATAHLLIELLAQTEATLTFRSSVGLHIQWPTIKVSLLRVIAHE